VSWDSVVLVLAVLAVAVWVYLSRRRQEPVPPPERPAAASVEFTLDQLRLMQRLVEEEKERIEAQRQGIIDGGAKAGKTISTDRAVRYAEELRQRYLAENREDDAREVEGVIKAFREKYGSEIPVDEAYRLSKEWDRNT
jgi:hypothetical protein